jgi:hypothetical protein
MAGDEEWTSFPLGRRCAACIHAIEYLPGKQRVETAGRGSVACALDPAQGAAQSMSAADTDGILPPHRAVVLAQPRCLYRPGQGTTFPAVAVGSCASEAVQRLSTSADGWRFARFHGVEAAPSGLILFLEDRS